MNVLSLPGIVHLPARGAAFLTFLPYYSESRLRPSTFDASEDTYCKKFTSRLRTLVPSGPPPLGEREWKVLNGEVGRNTARPGLLKGRTEGVGRWNSL